MQVKYPGPTATCIHGDAVQFEAFDMRHGLQDRYFCWNVADAAAFLHCLMEC